MSKWGKPLYEATPEAAAKIVAKHYGDVGRVGGWIYTPAGRPMYHGWLTYARALDSQGVLKAKLVTDPKKGIKVTRYAINWRRLRRPQ